MKMTEKKIERRRDDIVLDVLPLWCYVDFKVRYVEV